MHISLNWVSGGFCIYMAHLEITSFGKTMPLHKWLPFFLRTLLQNSIIVEFQCPLEQLNLEYFSR